MPASQPLISTNMALLGMLSLMLAAARANVTPELNEPWAQLELAARCSEAGQI